ncbi:ribonuclease domain-containing protein [Nocardia camponoti]|uniref:Uncharacterized protein n=1 Tax=Nocardia camponoti TaxID=1616106 RepID=A0A917QLH1_9NOCA|nr:ribonuclease domain-containing protein [Nocardia camponoti]GGK56666.1 hypothetical protein GCM10011591_30960 [Nocardia camponoti]
MKLSAKTLGLLGGLALVIVAVLLTLFAGGSTQLTSTKAATTTTSVAKPAAKPQPVTTQTARAPGVPDRAYVTLAEIDAGRWPDSANAPGTKGGDPWMNRGGDLPAKDASGKSISYQEWDVNPKARNRSRDAERIVTGSDGSVWYTGDHYETFTRMR